MNISNEVKALSELCEVKCLASTPKMHTFQVKNATEKLHEVDITINCNCEHCVKWAGMGKICHTSLAAITYISTSVEDTKKLTNKLKLIGERDQIIIEHALSNMRDSGLITQRDIVDLNRRLRVATIKKEEKQNDKQR